MATLKQKCSVCVCVCVCSLVRLAANTYWIFSLCARTCVRLYRISKFNPHHDPGKSVLLQMRKHGHREVKTLARGLTARKWQSWYTNPGSAAPEVTLCYSPLLKWQNVTLVIYDDFITELLSFFFFFKGLSFLLYLQWPQWGLLTLSFSIKEDQLQNRIVIVRTSKVGL